MSSDNSRATVCFLISSPMTLRTLEPHIVSITQSWRVVVIANFAAGPPFASIGPSFSAIHVPISRGLAFKSDLKNLLHLCSLFLKLRPELLVTLTPKAGLLGQLAGRLVGLPLRTHWFTGQVWANKKGFAKFALKTADWLISSMCTLGWVDGHSQMSFLMRQGVVSPKKFSVIGPGSVAGVDTERYRPDPLRGAEVRRELQIALDEVVVSFVGRLTLDKGVLDLVDALVGWGKSPRVCLLVVGPDEGLIEDGMKRTLQSEGVKHRFVGYVSEVEKYLQASDIFCLPSYREGFPSSVLQAAAVGLPVVVSRIYGTHGTFLEGTTGVSFSPGNRDELADSLKLLVESKERRQGLGLAGRAFVSNQFEERYLVNAFREEIECYLQPYSSP